MEDVINVYCRMPLCSYALTIPVKMVFKGNYLIVASRCPELIILKIGILWMILM
ncbi:MAG: hypothetical protein ACTSRP_27580 [Candidatus Helarchaeota archaeon]